MPPLLAKPRQNWKGLLVYRQLSASVSPRVLSLQKAQDLRTVLSPYLRFTFLFQLPVVNCRLK